MSRPTSIHGTAYLDTAGNITLIRNPADPNANPTAYLEARTNNTMRTAGIIGASTAVLIAILIGIDQAIEASQRSRLWQFLTEYGLNDEQATGVAQNSVAGPPHLLLAGLGIIGILSIALIAWGQHRRAAAGAAAGYDQWETRTIRVPHISNDGRREPVRLRPVEETHQAVTAEAAQTWGRERLYGAVLDAITPQMRDRLFDATNDVALGVITRLVQDVAAQFEAQQEQAVQHIVDDQADAGRSPEITKQNTAATPTPDGPA